MLISKAGRVMQTGFWKYAEKQRSVRAEISVWRHFSEVLCTLQLMYSVCVCVCVCVCVYSDRTAQRTLFPLERPVAK